MKGPIKERFECTQSPKTRPTTNHYNVVEVVDIEGSDGRWRRWLNLRLDTRFLGYAVWV